MRIVLTCLLALILAGCGFALPNLRGPGAAPSAVQSPGSEDIRPTARPGASPGDAIAGASAGLASAPGPLGATLATLGDATEPGLWLETPLVGAQIQGRVTAASGASVEVTLIPSGGAVGSGSRISLAAMQALGLPLTAIAEIEVAAL